MDFNEHVRKTFTLWTEAQKSMFESAVEQAGKAWNPSGVSTATDKAAAKAPALGAFAPAAEMTRLWMEGSRQFFDAFPRGTSGAAAAKPEAADPFAHVRDLWRSSQTLWNSFAEAGWPTERPVDALAEQTFRKLLDPATWLNGGTDQFDLGVERLSEGPAFATLWDTDRILARLAEARAELNQASGNYHALVLGCWTRAYQRFLEELASKETADQPKGWRALLDAWSAVTNAELIAMHRSEAFLAVQREVIRKSMEYRLCERELAEAYCEANHVPTRSEVDELQKIVYELRREVRALRRAGAAAK